MLPTGELARPGLPHEAMCFLLVALASLDGQPPKGRVALAASFLFLPLPKAVFSRLFLVERPNGSLLGRITEVIIGIVLRDLPADDGT